jgi:hypothetical protein
MIMRLPLFGTVLFVVALAMVQSHPNVRRRGQEGFSPGHAYGSDSSSTESNPDSTGTYGSDSSSTESNPDSTGTVPADDNSSGFSQSGQQSLGNSGTNGNNVPTYSAPETLQQQDPSVLNAPTQATNPDSAELSSNVDTSTGQGNQAATTGEGNQAATMGNQAATTGEGNQADSTGEGNQADTTGEGNQADTTGEGNLAGTTGGGNTYASQTNNPNEQGGYGASAQTQDTSAYAAPAETNQSGTEVGTNTYSETQDTTTSGNPAETNQNGTGGEGEPAQAPAPAPTETNEGGTYQQGGGESTPATSPTRDADVTYVDTPSPSEAVVAAAPAPSPTVDSNASDNRPTEQKENYEDPWGNAEDPWANAAEEENTEPYEPPDDDPVDEGMDGEVENDWEDKTTVQIAEEDLKEALNDKYVPIVAAGCGVIAFFFMIFVAQQMIENPDGCCAKVCRCSVACCRILSCPCRYICCCGGSRAKARRTHDLVSDNGSYGNGNYGYTHDLELT